MSRDKEILLLEILGTVQDIEHTLPLPALPTRAKCKAARHLLVRLAGSVWLGEVVQDALAGWWLVKDLSVLERCPLVPVVVVSIRPSHVCL